MIQVWFRKKKLDAGHSLGWKRSWNIVWLLWVDFFVAWQTHSWRGEHATFQGLHKIWSLLKITKQDKLTWEYFETKNLLKQELHLPSCKSRACKNFASVRNQAGNTLLCFDRIRVCSITRELLGFAKVSMLNPCHKNHEDYENNIYRFVLFPDTEKLLSCLPWKRDTGNKKECRRYCFPWNFT